jgi:hypothetical protein
MVAPALTAGVEQTYRFLSLRIYPSLFCPFVNIAGKACQTQIAGDAIAAGGFESTCWMFSADVKPAWR